MFSPQTRTGETNKKTITLTDGGREQIQYFADAHGMTFSATIETLALIGMKADLTALLIPLLREVVDKAIQRNFNRLAKLSLVSAAEAAMAHDLATMLLLQLIRQEATANPDYFEDVMLVSHDPADELDARIRALYNEARQLARSRQQRLLETPLQELVTRLTDSAIEENEEESDA